MSNESNDITVVIIIRIRFKLTLGLALAPPVVPVDNNDGESTKV